MIRLPWKRAPRPRAARPHTDPTQGEAHLNGSSDASSVKSDAPWMAAVRGERAASIAGGVRSLQSRITSLLAAGLMISVGIGMLAWYYTEALSRPVGRAAAHAPLPEAAGEGMTLPPFGLAASPPVTGTAASASRASSGANVRSVPADAGMGLPSGQNSSPAASLPLAAVEGPPLDRAPGGFASVYRSPPQSSPHPEARDHRLSGEVFAGEWNGASSSLAATGAAEPSTAILHPGVANAQTVPTGPHGDALHTLLRPEILSATRAQVLPTQRLLLPMGSFIDCTLETAIDSTLPGMTTCVTATDTFSADGTVVLLERGTKLIGETRGEVRQGQARVFVVWMQARTPHGVAVQLDSPGTDSLGRSGLDGQVNRHFWERFGAAALVSTIDGVVQSEVQSSARGGTVVLDPTASQDVLTDILRSTVNIPPTIRVRNGARIQILVARDIDFRPVYELETR